MFFVLQLYLVRSIEKQIQQYIAVNEVSNELFEHIVNESCLHLSRDYNNLMFLDNEALYPKYQHM